MFSYFLSSVIVYNYFEISSVMLMSSSFFFFLSSTFSMDNHLFIHSPIYGHLGYFQHFGYCKWCCYGHLCLILYMYIRFTSLEPIVQSIRSHRIDEGLLVTARQWSKMVVRFYIPIKNVWQFQFFPIVTNTYYGQSFEITLLISVQ